MHRALEHGFERFGKHGESELLRDEYLIKVAARAYGVRYEKLRDMLGRCLSIQFMEAV